MSVHISEPATHGPNVNEHTHPFHVPQRAAAKAPELGMSLGAEFQLESSSVSEMGVEWAVHWATMRGGATLETPKAVVETARS